MDKIYYNPDKMGKNKESIPMEWAKIMAEKK